MVKLILFYRTLECMHVIHYQKLLLQYHAFLEVQSRMVQDLNPFEEKKEESKPKRREKVDPNADLFAMYSDSLKDKEPEPEKKQSGYKRELSPAEKALNASVASLGRRSTAKRINEGFVKPTLKEAVPGDLGLILPYVTMKSLIEMMDALNVITPGIANDHTLFYGVEAKFYSDRVACDSNFETKIANLYVGGDGAGITRGLAQAGANGVKIAREIIKKL